MFARRPLSVPQRLRRMFWPRGGWRRAVRYLWVRLHRLPGSPTAVARGFAIGTAFGVTPFIGLHLPIALLVALACRASLLAATAGIFFLGNYLTIVPIMALEYEMGRYMLFALGVSLEMGVNALSLTSLIEHPVASAHALWEQPLTVLPILLPTVLGSAVLAGILYIITLAVVRDAIASWRAQQRQHRQQRERS